MFIGELIKEYRTSNKLSQRAFASRTTLSSSYINTLEKIYDVRTGKPISVTVETAKDIANAMFMSVEEMLSRLDNSQEFELNSNIQIDEIGRCISTVPIVGTIKAGYDMLALENIVGEVQIPADWNKENYFGLKVKGDSMAPNLMENDIVIIKKQDDCESGEIAVVRINGEEGTIKKIIKTADGIELHSKNPYYPVRKYTNEEVEKLPIEIVGVFAKMERLNFE